MAENENPAIFTDNGQKLNLYNEKIYYRHKDKKYFSKNRKKLCNLKIFLLPLRKS